MATDVADAKAEAAPADAPPGGSGSSRGGVGKIAVLLVAFTALQVAVFYFLFPQSSGDADAADPEATVALEEDDSAADSSDLVEVLLDRFNCTNEVAVPGRSVNLDFELVAIVSRDMQTAFDLAANGEQKFRVRAAILRVARSASLADLSDPAQATIKRKFRSEINKVLRKSYVIDIAIPKYRKQEF